MKTTPNYERGVRYFWISADALALHCLGLGFGPPHLLALHTRKPKRKDKNGKPFRYHRVRLEVVRTKREAAAMDRHFKRVAEKSWKRFQAAMRKHGGKAP